MDVCSMDACWTSIRRRTSVRRPLDIHRMSVGRPSNVRRRSDGRPMVCEVWLAMAKKSVRVAKIHARLVVFIVVVLRSSYFKFGCDPNIEKKKPVSSTAWHGTGRGRARCACSTLIFFSFRPCATWHGAWHGAGRKRRKKNNDAAEGFFYDAWVMSTSTSTSTSTSLSSTSTSTFLQGPLKAFKGL